MTGYRGMAPVPDEQGCGPIAGLVCLCLIFWLAVLVVLLVVGAVGLASEVVR